MRHLCFTRKAVQAVPYISHLDRICNDHDQKYCCLCNHSPTSIEVGDTNGWQPRLRIGEGAGLHYILLAGQNFSLEDML